MTRYGGRGKCNKAVTKIMHLKKLYFYWFFQEQLSLFQPASNVMLAVGFFARRTTLTDTSGLIAAQSLINVISALKSSLETNPFCSTRTFIQTNALNATSAAKRFTLKHTLLGICNFIRNHTNAVSAVSNVPERITSTVTSRSITQSRVKGSKKPHKYLSCFVV